MTWDGRGDVEEGLGKEMKGIEWEMSEILEELWGNFGGHCPPLRFWL
jgi:hypothetical protein